MSVIPLPGLSLRSTGGLPGTISFFARFTGTEGAYALTCSHNVAPSWSSVVEAPSPKLKGVEEVRVPSSSLSDESIVGQLIWAAVLVPTAVDYDCGVVRITKTVLQEVDNRPINEVWMSEHLPEVLLLASDDMRLHGRLATQARMEGPLAVPLRTDGPFQYKNLFEVRYDTPTVGGMSGAPVLASTGELVGMHVGAVGDRAFFHRASELLNTLGMSLFRM